MATREARGTKRTCQNAECGSRFYDLNRDPITCPICESGYMLAPAVIEEVVEEEVEKPEPAPAPEAATPAANGLDAGDGDEVTDDDALVSLEDADAEIEGETVDDDDDDTFLEEEDDGDGDVSGIIGPVGDKEDDT
ncbi:MAG: TIGR02300 family protein [Hyphomicrobiaceae bacterium]